MKTTNSTRQYLQSARNLYTNRQIIDKGKVNAEAIREFLRRTSMLVKVQPIVSKKGQILDPIEETIAISISRGPDNSTRAQIKCIKEVSDGVAIERVYQWGYEEQSGEQTEEVK